MRTKRILSIVAILLVLTTLALCFTSCLDADNTPKSNKKSTTKAEKDNNNSNNNSNSNSNNNSNNSSGSTENNNNAFDELVDYILQNGEFNYTNGRTRLRLHEGYANSSQEEFTVVTIDYNPVSKEVVLTLYVSLVTIENRPFAFMSIGLAENTSQYRYAMEVDHGDSTTSYLEGYINSKTFTRDTLPEYRDYEGDPSDLDATRNFANAMATELLDYLDRLVSYRLDLSMDDFGFVAYN